MVLGPIIISIHPMRRQTHRHEEPCPKSRDEKSQSPEVNPGCLAPNQLCWGEGQAAGPPGGRETLQEVTGTPLGERTGCRAPGGQGDPAGGDRDAAGPGVVH